MKLLISGIIAATALAASSAQAAVVFSDDFASYGNATLLNAPTGHFAGNWTAGPTIDYLAAGDNFGGLCQGTGNCIDLDGSTRSSGLFATAMSFAAGRYDLSFNLLGSGRGTSEDVTVTFGDWTDTYSLNSGDNQMITVSLDTALDGVLSFQNAGGDNIGAILTSVEVAAVPVPAAGLLLLTALGGAAALRRTKD